MFDLPTDTAVERRRYREFRKHLIKSGFTMLQYSVYVRICPDRTHAEKYIRKVKEESPKNGNIQILMITEKQFNDMVSIRKGSSAVENTNSDETFLI